MLPQQKSAEDLYLLAVATCGREPLPFPAPLLKQAGHSRQDEGGAICTVHSHRLNCKDCDENVMVHMPPTAFRLLVHRQLVMPSGKQLFQDLTASSGPQGGRVCPAAQQRHKS